MHFFCNSLILIHNYNLFLFLRVTINKIMMAKINSKTIPVGNQKLISVKLNRFEDFAVVISELFTVICCVIVSFELTACDVPTDSLETAACVAEFFDEVLDDTICEDEASAVELVVDLVVTLNILFFEPSEPSCQAETCIE